MKLFFRNLLWGVLCLTVSQCFANGGMINSAEIAQSSLNGLSNCLHYTVVGMCFWLKCSFSSCRIKTTLKLSHYLPDAVVSVYTRPNNNPWSFAKNIVDPMAFKAGQLELRQFEGMNLGGGDEHDNSSADLNNRFHEVDIIGNPIIALFKNYKALLSSSAKPYLPYYSSLLDAQGWRFPGLERFYPGAEIPNLHEVGVAYLHDWGSIYPRNGYINQPDDAKAAAVDALRATTIITEEDQPHIYKLLSNKCGRHCYVDKVKENSPLSQFQMVYPNKENKCVVFGKSDAASLRPWESEASLKGNDRYVWVLWRHYRGCVQELGAKYLGSVGF